MIDRRSLLCAGAALAAAPALPALGAPPASLRMAVVGDCVFNGSTPMDDPPLKVFAPILQRADVTIGNFEGTLADDGSWAIEIAPEGKPICGGLNVRGDAKAPADLKSLGFDMMGTANNHAWDWGPDGVNATVRKLAAAGLNPAGTGKDLAAARQASVFQAKGARVALIACTSTFWPGTQASPGNAAGPGRPGVNPLRYRTEGGKTVPDPRDFTAIVAAVRAARAEADIVVVSCHTHEDSGKRESPPDFQRQFAYACIEAGCGVFFSHGPHVLRGVEVKDGAAILYGLGAFIWRVHGRHDLPQELYDNCGVKSGDAEALFKATGADWGMDTEFWEGALAELEFNAGKVSAITLTPNLLQHEADATYGMPILADAARAHAILTRMQVMSQPFGTTIQITGSTGRIRL